MNCQLWSQEAPEKFIIRTYGLPSWEDYDQIADSISHTWGIEYWTVAGCVVTDVFVDSIKQLNDHAYKKIENFYGKEWEERLNFEIDSIYNLLRIKKENTYETIANYSNDEYYFQAQRNLIGDQTNIMIVSLDKNRNRKNDLKITGLQNKDPRVVYRGYINKLELEFNFTEDTLLLALRSKGAFQLIDSCLVSNKILFTYRASSIADTLFVKRSNGETIQYTFDIQNLSPPVLTLNDLRLNSTFSKRQLKRLNEIGAKLQDDALVDLTFNVESWELIIEGNSVTYKGSGNEIPANIGKELKKLNSGTSITLQTKVRSSDSVLRRKAVTFTLN